MNSLILGSRSSALAEEIIQLQEPSWNFDVEGLVNALATFRENNPFFTFGVCW